MLLVLPLQAFWAAAASYCQHESETSTYHFGHHLHTRHDDASADGKQQRSTLLSHVDCLHSHGGILALAMEPLKLALQPDSIVNPSFNTDRFSSLLPDRPEKPKWLRAA